MRVYRGKIFKLEEHLARLLVSSSLLGRFWFFDKRRASLWLKDVLRENPFPDAVVRFSLHSDPRAEKGRWLVLFREFKGYPEKLYIAGVGLNTASGRRDSPRAVNAQIKCSQYVSGVLASIDLGAQDQREILFLDQNLTLAEGTISNIFIVRGKSVLTPGPASGILEGVTRRTVIELAQKEGFAVRESFLTRHELYNADECFMTNTSSQILPVVNADGRRIGSGKPGSATRQLMKVFDQLVNEELSS